MTTVPVEEITNNAEAYLQKVKQGETVLIEREGVPVAEIKPVESKKKNCAPSGYVRVSLPFRMILMIHCQTIFLMLSKTNMQMICHNVSNLTCTNIFNK